MLGDFCFYDFEQLRALGGREEIQGLLTETLGRGEVSSVAMLLGYREAFDGFVSVALHARVYLRGSEEG